MTTQKFATLALAIALSPLAGAAGFPLGSSLCNQIGDYGMRAWEAYDTGSTRRELLIRAERQASGNDNAALLMKNAILTAIAQDSAGAARRAVVKQMCE